jgi:hypothetical protein
MPLSAVGPILSRHWSQGVFGGRHKGMICEKTMMRSMIAGALAAISILCPARLNALVTGCAVVQQTPNGVSNLHKAPTINSEVVAQLRRGDFLFVDTARCETGGSLSICDRGHPRQWTHVTSVRRIDGKEPRKATHGWASDLYVRWVRCEEHR